MPKNQLSPQTQAEETVQGSPPSALPEFLTAKDLASLFHISPSGAYNLLNSADFPTLRIGSRKIVSREDLRLWMRRNTNPTFVR